MLLESFSCAATEPPNLMFQHWLTSLTLILRWRTVCRDVRWLHGAGLCHLSYSWQASPNQDRAAWLPLAERWEIVRGFGSELTYVTIYFGKWIRSVANCLNHINPNCISQWTDILSSLKNERAYKLLFNSPFLKWSTSYFSFSSCDTSEMKSRNLSPSVITLALNSLSLCRRPQVCGRPSDPWEWQPRRWQDLPVLQRECHRWRARREGHACASRAALQGIRGGIHPMSTHANVCVRWPLTGTKGQE